MYTCYVFNFVGNKEPYVGIQIEGQAGSWRIVDITCQAIEEMNRMNENGG